MRAVDTTQSRSGWWVPITAPNGRLSGVRAMSGYTNAPDRSTELEATGARSDQNKHPRFDVDFRFDTDNRDGELTVFLGLDTAECEAIWNDLQNGGHEYPDDARERVFEALRFNAPDQ